MKCNAQTLHYEKSDHQWSKCCVHYTIAAAAAALSYKNGVDRNRHYVTLSLLSIICGNIIKTTGILPL